MKVFSNCLKHTLLICFVTSIIACDHIEENEREYNVYRCETKGMELKGVIDSIDTKTNYMSAHLDNREEYFSLSISDVKYKRGFPENYSYRIGDSLIKKAGSKEFMIKRGEKLAVYILHCDD